MVKASSKNITLSDFRTESYNLLTEVGNKISSNALNPYNFEMHDNYKIDLPEIQKRLDGIAQKFRKCEMNYYLHFDDIHHNVLTVDQSDLPISRQRIFSDGPALTKQFFDVNDKSLYEELINGQFQEFILFIASVIENLVYLAETLIRKVVVHLKNKQPPSIIMQNYVATLEILLKLQYRSIDPISTCLSSYKTFFDKYLPTINAYRNAYIHGYRAKLMAFGSEYMLDSPMAPIQINTLDARVDIFSLAVINNVRSLITDFFNAITQTINTATHVPA
ncbi:hypothetical protein [Sphingobacterium detergens]|uniref:Cthe-2314-like HEPN domain-containing protein n=1 Tax=Sphingobacterium detergens TaxID=1145106 RepID=A0A420ARP6_SPHD1|nr:hypothetical protein [Sphingobacterium detergens]RKE47154.1 hypothetical protein DFQ12_4316 [Sphingobacterium detergens]